MRLAVLSLLFGLAANPCSISHVPHIWSKNPDSKSRLFAFERNGRTGFIQTNGAIVIQPALPIGIESIGDFVDGIARVGNSGYIDDSGKFILRSAYEHIDDFSDGLALGTIGPGKFAYTAPAGNEVFRIAARSASNFSEGLAAFEIKGKPAVRIFKPGEFVYRDFPGLRGFIDKSGAVAIPPTFAAVGPFIGGLARAVIDGYCHIATPEGDRVGSPASGYPSSCGGAPSDAVTPCPVGFINREGHFAVPARFESARDFREGLAAVKSGGKWGFIDKTGAHIIPAAYERAQSFFEGLAAVQFNGKWGFIDKTGAMRIAPTLTDVESFSDSLALAGPPGKRFYLDRQGRKALPGPYLEATPFVHGIAAIRKTAKFVEYIDKSGRTVFRYQYGQ